MSGGLPQRYRVYGLALDSEVPLLGVQRRDDQTAGLIRISCTAPPAGALRDLVCLHEAPGRGQVAEPPFSILRSTSSGWTVWRWQDGITFSLSPDGRSVHAGLPAGETEASLAYYLVGPILAYLLRDRGISLLHGSVVACGPDAVGFLGPSGAGKSTLAAACVARGFTLVTDDLIALCEAGTSLGALPGYSGSRLWPDAAAALLGPERELPRIVDTSAAWPGWDKRWWASPARALSGPVRLSRIYLLQPDSDDHAHFQSMPKTEALIALDQDAYQPFLRTEECHRSDFAVFARLAEQVPVKKLYVAASLAQLGRVVDAVLRDLATPAPVPAECTSARYPARQAP